MDVPGRNPLISVKGSAFHNPAAIAAVAAALGALLFANIFAFASGSESLWVIGTVLIADMLTVGVGIAIAAREVMRAERRSGQSQARLDAIVDSAMDAIVTVDGGQRIVLFNRAAEQIFGVHRDDAIGSPLERFIRSASAARTAAMSSTSATRASPAGAWATPPRCGRCAPTASSSPSRPPSRRLARPGSASTP